MIHKTLGTIILLWLFIMNNGLAFATDFGPFSGKIVDADTKEPLEGVVVLAEWHKKQLLADASIYLDAQETVTDKDGKFYLSGIWVFNPFHRYTVFTTIIIFKSGYEAIDIGAISNWSDASPRWGGIINLEDRRKPVFGLKKLTMEERRKKYEPDFSTEAARKGKMDRMLEEINKDRAEQGLRPFEYRR